MPDLPLTDTACFRVEVVVHRKVLRDIYPRRTRHAVLAGGTRYQDAAAEYLRQSVNSIEL